MKSLQQMVSNMQGNGLPPSNEQPQHASDGAKDFIDRLFEELKATYPAWNTAMKDKDAVNNAKRAWVKAFMENGITQIAQVKVGLVHARKDARPFFPSVGEFIQWCKGVIDTDEPFERMIKRLKPRNDIEVKVWADCAFECRTRLPEDKARALFKKHYIKWHERKQRGEMPDPNQKAITQNRQTKDTDHMVEERMRSNKPKTKLEQRIEALRGK